MLPFLLLENAMKRRYSTKHEIFTRLMSAAKKAESAALALIDCNSPAGEAVWDLANKLFAQANAYSIRWNIH